ASGEWHIAYTGPLVGGGSQTGDQVLRIPFGCGACGDVPIPARYRSFPPGTPPLVSRFPLAASVRPAGITAGPDGNGWFTEHTGKRTGPPPPRGQVPDSPPPTPQGGPAGITLGPDGNLWFTEDNGGRIGRITPDGQITEFPLPFSGTSPSGITS